jgi:hypothetical protein
MARAAAPPPPPSGSRGGARGGTASAEAADLPPLVRVVTAVTTHYNHARRGSEQFRHYFAITDDALSTAREYSDEPREFSESTPIVILLLSKLVTACYPTSGEALYRIEDRATAYPVVLLICVAHYAPLCGVRTQLRAIDSTGLVRLLRHFSSLMPTDNGDTDDSLMLYGASAAIMRRFFANPTTYEHPCGATLARTYFPRMAELACIAGTECLTYDDLSYDIVMATERGLTLTRRVFELLGRIVTRSSESDSIRSLFTFMISWKLLIFTFAQARQRHSHITNFPSIDSLILRLPQSAVLRETISDARLMADFHVTSEAWRDAMMYSRNIGTSINATLSEALRTVVMGPLDPALTEVVASRWVPGDPLPMFPLFRHINARTLWVLCGDAPGISKDDLLELASKERVNTIMASQQAEPVDALPPDAVRILANVDTLRHSTVQNLVFVRQTATTATYCDIDEGDYICYTGDLERTAPSVLMGTDSDGLPLHLIMNGLIPVGVGFFQNFVLIPSVATAIDAARRVGHILRFILLQEGGQNYMLVTYASRSKSVMSAPRTMLVGGANDLCEYIRSLGKEVPPSSTSTNHMEFLAMCIFELVKAVMPGVDVPTPLKLWTVSHYTKPHISTRDRIDSYIHCYDTVLQSELRLDTDRKLLAVGGHSDTLERVYGMEYPTPSSVMSMRTCVLDRPLTSHIWKEFTRARDTTGHMVLPAGTLTKNPLITYFQESLA